MMRLLKYASLLFAAAMLSSCGDPADPDNPDQTSGDLVLTVDKQIIQSNGNDAATLTVTLDGKAVTSDVIFHDSRNNDAVIEIKDFRFTTLQQSEYGIWAEYRTYISNEVKITSFNAEIPTTPSDPVMQNKVVRTAVHSYNENDPAYINKYVTSGNYPMINVDFVEPRGYYTSDTPADIRNWMEEVHSTQDAMAGIAVNSAYKDGQIVIKTSVKAAVEGQYRIGALLVEDGIEGQQNGAKPSETDMHIHNHCVSFADCASNHSGHKLGTIKAGDTVEYFFSWDLNDASMQWNKKPHGGSLWKAPVMENTYLVICVYVTDSTGKSIIVNNAVTAAIGASVQFEYK